ncbi:MAG: polysaccharide biosynthesis protein [Eubacteriales bacterium]|nr:polysaccharide biosynthesis protein [Eubacteriales bacterium]
MSQKKILIKGAFILTITGFITRIIGFFYRIFLSRNFGEEGVGLYQLIFPVYALGFSLTCAGIQTAISRCVAGRSALGKHSQAKQILYVGIGLSVCLSLAVMLLTQHYAEFIALCFLHEERCIPLLTVLSYAFPFASVHSCICGYYMGLKQAEIPATSQLIEQIVRVASVYLLYRLFVSNDGPSGIIVAVAGLITGEMASAGFCIYMLRYRQQIRCSTSSNTFSDLKNALTKLLALSIPLTANRILLNVLQSIEAVSIPIQLRMYGLSTRQSLSMYGVLTGMALPCVMFPSAVTNSIASMMLPAIAELQAAERKDEMKQLIKKAGSSCFSLGLICCVGLLVTGRFIGRYIFHSEMSGDFIITLAWICPFLYTNNNLISIINGLGKTSQSFLFNSISLTIRILSVFLCIPFFGINGYLWGMLASQLILFLSCISFLAHRGAFQRNI